MGILGASILVLLFVFIVRPAILLGVGGKALHHSVQHETSRGAALTNSCQPSNGAWSCAISDRGSSSSADYEVKAESWGCWDARRVSNAPPEGGTPRRSSGCINAYDVLRPFDRVLD